MIPWATLLFKKLNQTYCAAAGVTVSCDGLWREGTVLFSLSPSNQIISVACAASSAGSCPECVLSAGERERATVRPAGGGAEGEIKRGGREGHAEEGVLVYYCVYGTQWIQKQRMTRPRQWYVSQQSSRILWYSSRSAFSSSWWIQSFSSVTPKLQGHMAFIVQPN